MLDLSLQRLWFHYFKVSPLCFGLELGLYSVVRSTFYAFSFKTELGCICHLVMQHFFVQNFDFHFFFILSSKLEQKQQVGSRLRHSFCCLVSWCMERLMKLMIEEFGRYIFLLYQLLSFFCFLYSLCLNCFCFFCCCKKIILYFSVVVGGKKFQGMFLFKKNQCCYH